MQPLQFSKMHALGNDFVVLNCLDTPFQWSSDDINALADRNSGIGFDQLLIVEPPPSAEVDFAYRIFNSDGAEVEHCGNGARCFGKYVVDKQLFTASRPLTVAVKKGVINIAYIATKQGIDYFRVNMGAPDFSFLSTHQESSLVQAIEVDGEKFDAGIVSMGNPHAVLTVAQYDDKQIQYIGQALQHHQLFPAQVNVGFMQLLARDHICLRVFERGVGETQACGTGACAAVAVGRAQGRLDACVTVSLTRGDLLIEWQGDGHPLYMTGPAEHVYDGLLTC